MAGTNSNCLIDPNSGFCSKTKTFRSLRPTVSLPPPSQRLSITQFILSLHQSTSVTTTNTNTFLIDPVIGQRLTYADFVRQTNSLAFSLHKHYSLSKYDVAFILSPSSFKIPILYFSLLSLGVVISPVNPLGSNSEISRQVHLSRPSIAFATSHTSHKLPPNLTTVLIDSPDFLSLLSTHTANDVVTLPNSTPPVNQSDSAALLYSSGTTGRVKGVLLTHRNLIAVIATLFHFESETNQTVQQPSHPIWLSTLPLFHIFGFLIISTAVALSETVVFMERFDFATMLKAVEKYKVNKIPVSPPIIVALVKSELTKTYDLTSLRILRCGGSPLGKEVAEKFKEKFPHVEILQGFGLTECGGVAAGMREPNETKRPGSVGLLYNIVEARIVDPVTGEALPPGQQGELWLRGPNIMKGYSGDNKATSDTLDSEGWLKTGDLCYFDSNGYLFIVDRLKELIKYKAYQVPPAELEHLLQSNPDIADAAVIPYPNEEAGQIPMAFVVRKPGCGITEAQVMDFIAKQVAPHKKIRRVAFINSVPKSPAGKILRRELVSHALSGNTSKL
ncbi:4-coumarate:CoA ligase-like protein [Melia azedarach]|uniref:4-coumarate:CoA ligase-like protein n=1 Tax=Melia azedarach TaxID=155640 RepID=A0ACC1XMS7_MELAZ|nr:4-coumarate:CoA ligase-like protein [Melia azedarach]